jgi:hypothetical protein
LLTDKKVIARKLVVKPVRSQDWEQTGLFGNMVRVWVLFDIVTVQWRDYILMGALRISSQLIGRIIRKF